MIPDGTTEKGPKNVMLHSKSRRSMSEKKKPNGGALKKWMAIARILGVIP
jgi:hypothetical protein